MIGVGTRDAGSGEDAIAAVVAGAERAGIDVPVTRADAIADAAFVAKILGDRVDVAVAVAGYPGEVEIPGIADALYLYAANDLADRQRGYRDDAVTGEPASGWDPAHWVIADMGADPFTVGPDHAVFFARHGMGRWDHRCVAPDFLGFLQIMRAWIAFFVVDHGRAIVDDDYVVLPERRDALIARIATLGLGVEATAVVSILLGD